jgi:hypothetical protein
VLRWVRNSMNRDGNVNALSRRHSPRANRFKIPVNGYNEADEIA